MALPILILLKGPPPALWFDIVTFINSVIKWGFNEVFFSPENSTKHLVLHSRSSGQGSRPAASFNTVAPFHRDMLHDHVQVVPAQPFKDTGCSYKTIYSNRHLSNWTARQPSKSTKRIDQSTKHPVSGHFHLFMLRQLYGCYIVPSAL